MRNAAGLTLTVASAFLAVVALMVNSPALFYMGTALVATIFAAKLQARFAVRYLKFERTGPSFASVGDVVTVTLSVESLRKFNRPLLLIEDQLPTRLEREWVRHTLPVAPSFRLPVQVTYQFRPLRRGVHQWSKLTVVGTDALGLASAEINYEADKVSLKVFPSPIPFDVNLALLSGSGYEHTAPKRHLSASIDTRGVREYVAGDPVRHIHWPSTAKSGGLMVKDFESQASSKAAIWIQQSPGSDYGTVDSVLDWMCGHAAHLVERLLPVCSSISLDRPLRLSNTGNPLDPYLDVLADLRADQRPSFSALIRDRAMEPTDFGRIYLFVSVFEPELPAALQLLPSGSLEVFLYSRDEFDERSPANNGSLAPAISALERAGAKVRVMRKKEAK